VEKRRKKGERGGRNFEKEVEGYREENDGRGERRRKRLKEKRWRRRE
jgi:hypothetical protein